MDFLSEAKVNQWREDEDGKKDREKYKHKEK